MSSDTLACAGCGSDAFPLLPPESKQHALVAAQIDAALARTNDAARAAMREGPAAGSRWAKILGPLGAAGLLLWKLKFILVALLTKGKLLLLGLSKMTTIVSALAFLGVYWKAWGWQFALAVVVMIYIHEMGHVAAMARRGMPAQAPMFIPGVGAFVRMSGSPVTPAEGRWARSLVPYLGRSGWRAAPPAQGVIPRWAADRLSHRRSRRSRGQSRIRERAHRSSCDREAA